MISVLTLTYKRHHLLEEAIKSFLSQDIRNNFEMVVINDNPEVDYIFENHRNVRIINHKERFPSISAKIEWGYKQCKHDFIYRLDDDDLLTPWALRNVKQDIEEHPGFDIYRSKGMYFFSENKYEGRGGSTNNGNVYAKSYLDRIKFPDTSFGEDSELTFGNKSKIYESKLKHTMIYRWGMGTLHVSGMGDQPNHVVLAQADKVLDNTKGRIVLQPKFQNDYYEMLPK
jgi:glycosyltransferase involved in cell wall biosynthesis